MATVSCSAPEYPKGKKNMSAYSEKTAEALINLIFATIVILFAVAWLVNLTWVNVVPVFWPNRPYLTYWEYFPFAVLFGYSGFIFEKDFPRLSV